jgi:hypothetical protein
MIADPLLPLGFRKFSQSFMEIAGVAWEQNPLSAARNSFARA